MHGICELCSEARPLVVDHSHVTMMIRGNICVPCNLALPKRWEDLKWREKALIYLSRNTGILYRTHKRGPRPGMKVPREELKFLIKRLDSKRAVGQAMNVSSTSIDNWLRHRKIMRFILYQKLMALYRAIKFPKVIAPTRFS